MAAAALVLEIKELIVRELNLQGKQASEIDADAPLFGSGLGLDSLDALQLAMALEERFALRLPDGDEVRPLFASVTTLAEYVASHRPRT